MKNSVIVALPFFLLFLAASFSTAFADGEDIPRIPIEELKKRMDEGAPVTIVDVQPKSIYAKGHIKGALSLPWKPRFTMEQVAHLPKGKPIVTYCDCGPGEPDSASVAAQLFNLGFPDVQVLKDPSIKGWKQAGYPME